MSWTCLLPCFRNQHRSTIIMPIQISIYISVVFTQFLIFSVGNLTYLISTVDKRTGDLKALDRPCNMDMKFSYVMCMRPLEQRICHLEILQYSCRMAQSIGIFLGNLTRCPTFWKLSFVSLSSNYVSLAVFKFSIRNFLVFLLTVALQVSCNLNPVFFFSICRPMDKLACIIDKNTVMKSTLKNGISVSS